MRLVRKSSREVSTEMSESGYLVAYFQGLDLYVIAC